MRGWQRSDSTHVLAAVRALNRLECVAAMLPHALNSLAVIIPDWLERYGSRMQDYRLPESKEECAAFATIIGADGLALLQAIDAADAPNWLRMVPAVVTLRRGWLQNYTWTEQGTLRGRIEAVRCAFHRTFRSNRARWYGVITRGGD